MGKSQDYIIITGKKEIKMASSELREKLKNAAFRSGMDKERIELASGLEFPKSRTSRIRASLRVQAYHISIGEGLELSMADARRKRDVKSYIVSFPEHRKLIRKQRRQIFRVNRLHQSLMR